MRYASQELLDRTHAFDEQQAPWTLDSLVTPGSTGAALARAPRWRIQRAPEVSLSATTLGLEIWWPGLYIHIRAESISCNCPPLAGPMKEAVYREVKDLLPKVVYLKW